MPCEAAIGARLCAPGKTLADPSDRRHGVSAAFASSQAKEQEEDNLTY